jgi:hypothetical protein
MSPPERPHRFNEAAHKLDPDGRDQAVLPPPKTGLRRNFNEAAHKLGYWPVRPEPRPDRTTPEM